MTTYVRTRLTRIVLPRAHRQAACAFLISIIGPACTGGSFHVEPALAATPMVPVSGTLGLNNRNCEPGLELPDHDAPVAVGSLTGVAGAGAIRGFELRTATGQVAAVSFWQVPESTGGTKEPRYLPRAWMLPSQRKGWSDVVAATLALAYVYPWPTACDAQRLRTKGLSTVEGDMMR